MQCFVCYGGLEERTSTGLSRHSQMPRSKMLKVMVLGFSPQACMSFSMHCADSRSPTRTKPSISVVYTTCNAQGKLVKP